MTAAYSIAAPAGVATKVCSKCGECKPATAEVFANNGGGRLRAQCKPCDAARVREWVMSNPDKAQAIEKQKYQRKKDAGYFSTQESKQRNRESKQRRKSANPEEFLAKNRESHKKWREAHPDRVRDLKRDSYLRCVKGLPSRRPKSRRSISAEARKRYKEKYLQNPVNRLAHRVRLAVRRHLKKPYGTNAKTKLVLGCTFEEFRKHIERQFLKGMTWENLDQWHIDHIIPMATAKTEEDVIRLNHYTNLRPLWAEDNLRKGARIDYII